MISDYRRVVVLSVLAVLLGGSAIASRRLAALAPADSIRGDRLLEYAGRAIDRKTAGSNRRAQTPEPQATPDVAKSVSRQFTVFRDESGEVVCREATPDEIRERLSADREKSGLR